jgi:dephospho-CoA kinase
MLPDGRLDRAALAAIVFSDPAARADLESIVHPEVYRRISEWFANQPAGTRTAIADIPLLFETGHEHDFDAIVVCACDPAEQLRRLIERDGLSKTAADARLAAQWPIGEKMARADYVIRTDGAFESTEAQVRSVRDALNARR